MNTYAKDALPGFGSTASAIQSLLTQVTHFCIVSNVSEREATEMLSRAFRDAGQAAPMQPVADAEAFIAAQVLSEWYQNTAYLDADCNPMALSLAVNEFSNLCRSASGAADPATILDLLIQAGAVKIQGDLVSATRREFILGDTHPVAVARAVRLASEFSSTLNYNLRRHVGEPSRFERTVVNVRLAPRQIPALLGYLSVHGQSFLEDLDSWMSARETSEYASAVGVGVYAFVGPQRS